MNDVETLKSLLAYQQQQLQALQGQGQQQQAERTFLAKRKAKDPNLLKTSQMMSQMQVLQKMTMITTLQMTATMMMPPKRRRAAAARRGPQGARSSGVRVGLMTAAVTVIQT